MSYNTFPTLEGLGWPIKVTPKFKTLAHQAASGAEFRTGLWQNPLREISVPINFMTQADYTTLLNFFLQQHGALIPFNFTPTQSPWTANAIPFGAWNGTATSAQLVDSRGNPISSATVSAIYRTDWQGQQLLYPTPRTNFIGNTAPGGTSWGIDPNTTVTVNAGTDPAGTSLATSIVTSSAGVGGVYIFPHATYPSIPNPPNGFVTFSVWLRSVSGSTSLQIGCDQPGGHLAPITISTSWSRYVVSFDWTGTGDIDATITMAASTSILAAFAQYEIGSTATAYYNPGVGLDTPITDYTLSGTTVNLAQAPAATATTTWDGTGSNAETYLVKFPDGVDFDQFLSQIYRTKTLKLQEVR